MGRCCTISAYGWLMEIEQPQIFPTHPGLSWNPPAVWLEVAFTWGPTVSPVSSLMRKRSEMQGCEGRWWRLVRRTLDCRLTRQSYLLTDWGSLWPWVSTETVVTSDAKTQRDERWRDVGGGNWIAESKANILTRGIYLLSGWRWVWRG